MNVAQAMYFLGASFSGIEMVVSRWPKSPFWYRNLCFGIEILNSFVQHLNCLGINPCVCALFWASTSCKLAAKKISIPKRRSKNLHTPKKTSRYQLKDSPVFFCIAFSVVKSLVMALVGLKQCSFLPQKRQFETWCPFHAYPPPPPSTRISPQTPSRPSVCPPLLGDPPPGILYRQPQISFCRRVYRFEHPLLQARKLLL